MTAHPPPPRYMTEEEERAFAAAVEDPGRIASVEEASSILETLAFEIADIESKLEDYSTREAGGWLPGEADRAWKARARVGARRRRRQRNLIQERRRQLAHRRRITALVEEAKAKARANGVEPDAAALLEASVRASEARAAKEKAKTDRVQAHAAMVDAGRKRLFATAFLEVAREQLPSDVFVSLWRATEARRKAENRTGASAGVEAQPPPDPAA